MGIDAGFDMVPALSKGSVDRHNWGKFIDSIKERYKDDPKVEVKPNYIFFKAGEGPMLPFEGHKFLRFSSKTSGSIAATTGVEDYIDTVRTVAHCHFGSRIRHWNECSEQFGHYSWQDVNESFRSYEQPDEIEIPNSIAQAVFGTDPFRELDIPLFEVKDIPGKGRGLVARFNISKGTRILCEKPLLTTQFMPLEELEKHLTSKLRALPKDSLRQFLSLHNNFPGKKPFSGIAKTNALPCGSGSPTGGVYATICFINHSCIPNAHNSWNAAKGHETIHAVRRIKKGTEITIPYGQSGVFGQRKTFLKDFFGFTCSCSACTLSPASLQASDTRRRQMRSLEEAIGNPFHLRSRPHKSLGDCYSLLQVLDQEFDGCAAPLKASVHYDAFQIAIAHSDQARASVFAEKAYQARVICEGEDSPETLRMKFFALKPSGHSSFGAASRKWRSTRTLLPKGLDTEQFDKWLFRLED